ncbi:hypothetical protein Tco_1104341, partial [Tanacetum coccineum]
ISLPTKLKDLPSKFNDLTEEVKGLKNQVHNLEIELPRELKEIPPKLEDFTKTITSLTSQVVKLKRLHLPKGSSQTKREHIKKDKGKKALSSEEAVKESTKSDSDDDEVHLSGSIVESSRIKKVKKIDFVTKDGKHIHLTKEQINQQKKIEEEAKAKAAKHESGVRKEELIDLLGPGVVNKYYNDKLQYDRYCEKMLNRRAVSKITNCDVLTIKCPITLKVYREDGTSEIIPNFKASTRMDYIHTTKAELGINLNIPLRKQDPLDKLNDLSNMKRKHADDIRDYFKAKKRLKSSVQYKDHLPGTVLNEPVLSSSASALHILRRLGSIFTSVYAAVQKLKKALGWSFSSAWLTIPS